MPQNFEVKSSKRTLEILELFEKIRRPARLSELAELLGYPRSSTSFLLHNLRDLGYLIYNSEDHTFAPSLRVALVGGWLQFGEATSAQVLALLSSIRDSTSEATCLSTRNGIHAQYIYTLDALKPTQMVFKAGTRRHLCRVPAGIVLIADLDDAEIGKLVRSINAEIPSEHVAFRDVLSLVRQARQDGCSCIVANPNPEWGSVAMRLPFYDTFNKPLAISIWGDAETIGQRKDDLARIIKEKIHQYCGSNWSHMKLARRSS